MADFSAQILATAANSGPSPSEAGGSTGSASVTSSQIGSIRSDAGDIPMSYLLPTGGVAPQRHYYKMKARDSVCVSQPAYVSWVVADAPDTDASEFNVGDMPCGTSLGQLVDIQVDAEWVDRE